MTGAGDAGGDGSSPSVLAQAARGGVLVIGAHFADPTAGWIKSEGEGQRFFGVGLED